jgi:hypothetical protein
MTGAVVLFAVVSIVVMGALVFVDNCGLHN